MCLQHRSVQLQNWIEIMTWCFKKLQSFLKINIWHCHSIYYSIYYSFASLTFKFGMQEFYSKWCFGRYVVHISCVTLPLPTVKSILWVLVASVAWYHSPFYFNFYGSSMSTEILPTIHFFLYKTFIHGIKKKNVYSSVWQNGGSNHNSSESYVHNVNYFSEFFHHKQSIEAKID